MTAISPASLTSNLSDYDPTQTDDRCHCSSSDVDIPLYNKGQFITQVVGSGQRETNFYNPILMLFSALSLLFCLYMCVCM